MAFLDPKKPEEYVRDLIDRVNRGEGLSEIEMIRLQTSYIGFKAVRDLVNPIGRRIIGGDVNILPI